jgi:hypothetical protein
MHQACRCRNSALGDRRTRVLQSMASPLFLFSFIDYLYLRGAYPLALSEAAKPSAIRAKRNHAFYINSNHINTTQGRRGKTARRAWSEQRSCYRRRVYISTPTLPLPTRTDTYTEPLEAGAPSTPTPTWCPSRQGAVYTDTCMVPLETRHHLHRHLHGILAEAE